MSALNASIRPETAADAAAIEAVTAAAFLDAPHTSHTEQFIVAGLRRAGRLAVSLVAEHEGKVIGHVALSPVTIADGAAGWFGLGPISVLPEYQRRGVGSRLMAEALRRLRERGAAGCLLVGEPGFYGRFGFRPASGLTLPGVPPEYFLALAFGAALPQGAVSFHEAFAAQGPDAG